MSPDYKKSLALLQQINEIQIDGKSLRSFFVVHGYDMWESYQMSLFADIKRWTVYPNDYKRDKKSRASVLRILLLIESLVALIFKKPDVLVYTIDKISSKTAENDVRIDSLYEVLTTHKIKYLEIVHAVSGTVTLGNFLTRKRLVVYLEAFMFGSCKFEHTVDLHNFEDKEFVLHLIKKYYHRLCTTKHINKIFTFIRPKAVWGIDDVRHTGELLIAAKEKKIPTYLFQHGHFTKYHVGWLSSGISKYKIPRADYIVVWNEYWKKELIRLGTYYPEQSIIIGGEKTKKKIAIETSTTLSVLIPYETDAPKEEVKKYIAALKLNNIRVYLKVRNDISHTRQVEEYGGDIESVTDIVPVTAIVGVYSTLLYDALGTIPVGILDTSMDYGLGMVENGLAGIVRLNSLKQDILNLKITKLPNDSALLSDTVYSIAQTCGIPSKK
jgi:hypothetical protein